MSKNLKCVVCGKMKNLKILRDQGLQTFIDCSIKRKDNFQSRVNFDGVNGIHPNCRKSYTKVENVNKAAAAISSDFLFCDASASVQIPDEDFNTSQFSLINEIESVSIIDSVIPNEDLEHHSIPVVWIVEDCGPSLNHHQYLNNVALRNGMVLVETIGGGSCFFDAVRQGLFQFDIIRTIPQLRFAAALELQINSEHYRPLYALEDHGQNEQAKSFEQFIEQTRDGFEWANAMTVAAMAKSLDVVIKVISTSTNHQGHVTAYQVDNSDGVRALDRMIVVGFDSVSAHYVGFRSPAFNMSCQPDLSPVDREFHSGMNSIHNIECDYNLSNSQDKFDFQLPPSRNIFEADAMDISDEILDAMDMSFDMPDVMDMSCDNIPMDTLYISSDNELECQNCLRNTTPSQPLNITKCAGSITRRIFCIRED